MSSLHNWKRVFLQPIYKAEIGKIARNNVFGEYAQYFVKYLSVQWWIIVSLLNTCTYRLQTQISTLKTHPFVCTVHKAELKNIVINLNNFNFIEL